MINSGVYQILNRANDHRYVGSSAKGVEGRLHGHYKDMSIDKGSNIILENAVKKYGIDNFRFEVLLYCDPENCTMYEQMVMDAFNPEYNIAPIAGSMLGFKHSEETKKKLSEALRGNQHLFGHKHSEESKKKMSDVHRGNTHALGLKHSDEAKQKMSDAHRGNTYWLGKMHSEASKNKMSVSNLGRKKTLGMTGKNHNVETRKKMSYAAKAAWKRRKMNGMVKL